MSSAADSVTALSLVTCAKRGAVGFGQRASDPTGARSHFPLFQGSKCMMLLCKESQATRRHKSQNSSPITNIGYGHTGILNPMAPWTHLSAGKVFKQQLLPFRHETGLDPWKDMFLRGASLSAGYLFSLGRRPQRF